MPYATIDDLPPAVRGHLPKHAREIFLAAFNDAFDRYAPLPDREAVAFRVAWSAVAQRFRKEGEAWVAK
jgi:cation transport regulator